MNSFSGLRAGAGTVPSKDEIEKAEGRRLLSRRDALFLRPLAGCSVRTFSIPVQERIGRLGATFRARGIRKQEKAVHELIGELKAPGADARLEAHERVRSVVNEWWPKHWPFVDLCLAAWSTLLMKDVTPALALITIGPTGAGKSTVLSMFEQTQAERSDIVMFANEISAAAILSAYGDASAKELSARAMYKRTKHKLLVTSDMVNLLRSGDVVALRHKFGRLAQWMDGRGMLIETGTHGTLGEKGDFRFVWLGATTMLEEAAWRTMSQLGARFLFYPAPRLGEVDRLSDAAYSVAIRECSDAILNYTNVVFPKDVNRIGTLPWPRIPARIEREKSAYAERIAAAQTVTTLGEALERPDQNHFAHRLSLLLHGRAIAHERTEVNEEDLRAITPVVARSAPGIRSKVLLAIYAGAETIRDIQILVQEHLPTVQNTVYRMEKAGVLKKKGSRVQASTPGPDPERWAYIPASEAAGVYETQEKGRAAPDLWERLNLGIEKRGNGK